MRTPLKIVLGLMLLAAIWMTFLAAYAVQYNAKEKEPMPESEQDAALRVYVTEEMRRVAAKVEVGCSGHAPGDYVVDHFEVKDAPPVEGVPILDADGADTGEVTPVYEHEGRKIMTVVWHEAE